MVKRILLSGYGNVGKEFVKLVKDNDEHVKEKYDIELVIVGIIGSQGCIYNEKGIDLDLLLKFGKGADALKEYGKINPLSFFKENIYDGDALVEATPTDIIYGQPALNIILDSIQAGLDIVSISKGALVTNFRKIISKARENNLRVKYSGATAAALPTIDIGEYSLAGCQINSIEGILNGTTNYILTRMHEENLSFEETIREAQSLGIAEVNSDLDVKGIDSGCKILLLSNSLLGTEYTIGDLKIQGIDGVTKEDIELAKKNGMVIKLLARAYLSDGKYKIEVKPTEIAEDHPLIGVKGTNKGIVFNTDTMGMVAAFGGASNPRGAAAAALKDIINLYR